MPTATTQPNPAWICRRCQIEVNSTPPASYCSFCNPLAPKYIPLPGTREGIALADGGLRDANTRVYSTARAVVDAQDGDLGWRILALRQALAAEERAARKLRYQHEMQQLEYECEQREREEEVSRAEYAADVMEDR